MTNSVARVEAEMAEMPFAIEENFYSRTDKRGVIAAGNPTFQRLSGFSWSELVGAPHKIVRNHDTPRAVFRIMWRSLQQNEPVVAYVRNKTQDGRGYWVIATILPIDDGYLSVRIKPTTPLFATVKSLYATLSHAERNEGLSIEGSEARLLEELAKLGYEDYSSFMAQAIAEEFKARDIATTQRFGSYFADTAKIRASLDATEQAQEELLRSFDRLRDLPTNMRILASRLEPSGGPISAISDIYNATSNELFHEISDFVAGKKSLCRRMAQAFDKSVLLKIASVLQHELVAQGARESMDGTPFDITAEVALLSKIFAKCEANERAGLVEGEQLANAMNRASADLRRSMLGLDTIRVMGRVESGRLGIEGSRIGATMDQIDTCHSGIIGLLQKIMDNAMIINSGMASIRAHFDSNAATAIAAR